MDMSLCLIVLTFSELTHVQTPLHRLHDREDPDLLFWIRSSPASKPRKQHSADRYSPLDALHSSVRLPGVSTMKQRILDILLAIVLGVSFAMILVHWWSS